MCTVSMVMDHYHDKWRPLVPTPQPAPFTQWPHMPTQQEIDEFRKLLERARKYDQEHNQPDCELAEKRQRLLDLAKELGIEIDFV